MPRFMIEVPHSDSKQACERAMLTFYRTGSHFMTHADWGCKDDVHKAIMIVELDSKEDGMRLLPPEFRKSASIVELEKLDPGKMDKMAKTHGE